MTTNCIRLQQIGKVPILKINGQIVLQKDIKSIGKKKK
ncbi:hypothetical protein L895_05275 [Staphylococcus aureus SA16]|nr:hypothetical protein L895_05275 [Staphylococcus aureus SA16]